MWTGASLTSVRAKCFALIAILCGTIQGVGAAGLSVAEQQALQKQIVVDLATGKDINALLERLKSQTSNQSRSALPGRSNVAGNFQRQLIQFRNTLIQIQKQLTTQESLPAGQQASVLAELEGLKAAHLLLLERFKSIQSQLQTAGVASNFYTRRDQAEQAYLNASGDLFKILDTALAPLSNVDAKLDLDTIKDAIAYINHALQARQSRILRASTLPYRQLSLAPRSPTLSPTIIPSYKTIPTVPSEIQDLSGTLEAPLSETILAKARELDNDYIRIHEFVRNEIKTEWYAGSMKGADETLLQKSGNDVDQASLLIALFRASGLASRYVHGVIELPIAAVMDSLGLTDAQRAINALTFAGIAFSPQIQGGKIGEVHIEHTWVAAHVPYSNYRGAVIDNEGRSWLPLMPALKDYTIKPAAQILNTMAFSVDDAVNNYLSGPQVTDVITVVRDQVNIYLTANLPNQTYTQQLGSIAIAPEKIGLLPHTLPVKVIAVTAESDRLTDARRQRIRFVVRAGTGDSANILLDYTVPVSEVASQRVTLSYIPATIDDQITVNQFGGLDNVPAYLIKLRPQIKVNGRQKAIAQDVLDMGIAHRFEMQVLGPNGTEQVDQTLISGSYHAIAIHAQQGTQGFTQEDDPADTEFQAAQLLDQAVQSYGQQWTNAETELGNLLDVAVIRPLPSIAITSNLHQVDFVLDRPFQLEWQGVSLDAALRIAEPIARSNTVQTKDWMSLSALQGSALEHKIFEDVFLVNSISADKGLGLATQQGIQVLTLDSSNIDSQLPSLNHPAAIIADIQNWVRQGRVVQVPTQVISFEDWQGSVWRVIDPISGAAGYFISGGLAGGASAQAPNAWLLAWLAEALAAANSPGANNNPLAVAAIRKITATDGQQGEVGSTLPTKLALIARDDTGLPVSGAEVNFKIALGGGKLNGGSLVATVLSNGLGIAEVDLELNQSTSDNPVFVFQNPADEHKTQVGLTLVEAFVNSRFGRLTTDAPFSMLAFPKVAAALIRTDIPSTFYVAGTFAEGISIQPRDEFGNPISNVDVTFATGTPVNSCDPPPATLLPAVVFDSRVDENGDFITSCPSNPILGDCGSRSITLTSASNGVSAGVIVGNAEATTYPVSVSSSGLPSQTHNLQTINSGGCRAVPFVKVSNISIGNESGDNINASRVGEVLKKPIRISVTFGLPSVDKIEKGEVFWLSDINTFRTTANVSFTVSNGGSASGASQVSQGTYQTSVIVGPTPGKNVITAVISNIQDPGLLPLLTKAVESAQTDSQRSAAEAKFRHDERWLETGFNPTTSIQLGLKIDVFGLDPKITQLLSLDVPKGQNANTILINDDNQSEFYVQLDYSIPPKEYISSSVEVDLLEDGVLREVFTGTSLSDTGTVTIPRSTKFDPNNTHEAQVVINRGSVVEVKSDKFDLTINQGIFKNVTRNFKASQDIDILNQRACTFGASFDFTLKQDATISLVFADAENPLATTTIIDNQLLPVGDHSFPILPTDLTPGNYTFELTGVSQKTGFTEVINGDAKSEFTIHDSLPVGHSLVKGVNVFTGSLSLGSTDMVVPGRGSSLEFRRTYGSNGSGLPGSLGIGWNHNYDSKIIITRCGEAIVIGAQGGGIRFVDKGDGTLVPLKGYHGTLIGNQTDRSFDFYSKDGTQFHYTNFGHLSSGQPQWDLEFTQDSNGNVTKLSYDPTSLDIAKVATVEDPAGRLLQFTWADRSFPGSPVGEATPVITQVAGPDGMVMSFDYDDAGNLIRAARETDARIETYTYNTDISFSIALRNKLNSYTNPNGATTNYTYNEKAFSVTSGNVNIPTLSLPMGYVTQVTDAENALTAFNYSLPTPPSSTTVTDDRGNNTLYTFNSYGSAVSIQDPAGTVNMIWASDDVLMTSRTDANGVKTDFTYDSNGNQLTETVNPIGPTTFTTTNTYESFAGKPWIKNRLKTRTDRNGNTTSFNYDINGNLITITDALANAVAHTYAANGDRIRSRDARGDDTVFTYDVYGNLATTTDALGNTTSTQWNERSLPISTTDARGNTTGLAYDSLNRLITKTDPFSNTRRFTYDPVGNKLTETDEQGRTTTWTYDKENRPTRIEDPLTNALVFSYDGVGNKTNETDRRGNTTTFFYDAANRLITQTEPLGQVTRFTYDPVGNVLTQTDAENRVTTFEYDVLNRRTKITDALIGITQMDYDGENKTRETDQLGRNTTFEYDVLNRLITRTEPLSRITRFEYDANGNRITEIDANGRSRRAEYDAINRLTRSIDALAHTTDFEYDKVSNLTKTIDARLSATQHQYDALNRRSKTIDPENFVTTFSYDKVGNKITEAWANGNTLTHTYDALYRLTKTVDTLSDIVTNVYDASGNRIQEADANGNVTTHTYDALNRLTQQDLPEVRTVKMSYDRVNNKLTETDANNNTTTFAYDALNRLTTVNDPLTNTQVFTYDPVGNRLTETDKRNNTTTFEYDDLNRLITTTDALNQTVTSTYDAVGNKLTETDKRGIVSKFSYDNENRLTQVVKDNVTLNTMQYDEVGNKKFDTDANGNVIAFIYDKRNLLIKESRPLAAITDFKYDNMGDRIEQKDPEGRVTTWSYDLRRRMATETNGALETITFTYDNNGNRLTLRRPNGNTWTTAYDGADRLISLTDPLIGVTLFTYDNNSNRLTQTGANGNTTSFEYDVLNRQTATQYPDTARETQAYDENGNRTQLTDAKSQVITYTYDVLNRETLRSYPLPAAPTGDDIQSIATTYDANNNPLTLTETYTGVTGTRVTTNNYDSFDRLQSVTDAFNKKLSYAYDANGNRTALTDPDGLITQYSFDALNRLSGVTTAAGVTNYAYDRSSLHTKVTYPNGSSATNTYDNASRIIKIENKQNSAIVSQYDYSFDSNGNRTQQIETNGGTAETTTYQYDATDRLTQVSYADAIVTYTYDANYNRLTETTLETGTNTTVVNKTYAYNNRNQLTGITDNLDATQNVAYQYDLNGNQIGKTKNNITTNFIYDVRDQLHTVREGVNVLGSFLYDYQGMRVAKTGADGLVRYTYDDDSVLLQTDGTGTTLAKYEYGPDRLLSLNHSTEGRQFYLFDGLGSTVNLVKPGGAIQARYQYDAWGNFRNQVGSSWNDFTFTGHERDEETNLYYFKARYYDPDTGRFLSQDAFLGEDTTPPSLHRYLYAYANPTVYIDLTGYASEERQNSFSGESDLTPQPEPVREQSKEERIESAAERGRLERERLSRLFDEDEAVLKEQAAKDRQTIRENAHNADVLPPISEVCQGKGPACEIAEKDRRQDERMHSEMAESGRQAREKAIEECKAHCLEALPWGGIVLKPLKILKDLVKAAKDAIVRGAKNTGKAIKQGIANLKEKFKNLKSKKTAGDRGPGESPKDKGSKGKVAKSPGDIFEENVKKTFRKKIIKENEILLDEKGKVVGQIDFETSEAIVEAGLSLGRKNAQLFRLAREAVKRRKRLDIIYGPNTPLKRVKILQDRLRKKFGNRVRFIPHR